MGTAGRKLFRAESVNRVPGARLPEGTCVTDTFGRKLCSQVNSNTASNGIEINPAGRLNPNYGRLRVWENTVSSIYHGLQLSGRKKMSYGFQVGGNYTYSHSIDGGSSWHNSQTTANGFAAGDGFTTDLTRPQLDRGNSTFDIRHRFAFNYVWQLPFMRNRHGTVTAIMSSEPVPISELQPLFPPALDGVVQTCLATTLHAKQARNCGRSSGWLAVERHLVTPNWGALDALPRGRWR